MTLHALLESKKRVLGVFSNIPDPSFTEFICNTDFDFIILDAEHSPFGLREIENCIRAASSAGIPAVVRMGDMDKRGIQQILDLGSSAIQLPQVNNLDILKDALSQIDFPPKGNRGFGSGTRVSRYGDIPRKEVMRMTSEDVSVIVQIESKKGIDLLDDVLKVSRVDVIFIGLSDLSIDLGYETSNHPELKEIVLDLTKRISKAGKIPGLFLSDWIWLKELAAAGARYFTISALPLIRQEFKKYTELFVSRFL
jgi:4-hydroxy-2-oxoheptanedioate aldolase